MGIGTLRRYHKPLADSGPEVAPGQTDTQELADEAALAEAAKLGEVQAEQRELAAAADPQPEGDAINAVLEGEDPGISAEHQDDEDRPRDEGGHDEPEVKADGEVAEAHTDAPKRNASTEAWREYVGGLTEQPEGWEDMSRTELANAVLGEPQA